MARRSQTYGQLSCALAAATLAVSVFLPWYGVSLTAGGAENARQGLHSAAQQYGNAAFQSAAGEVGSAMSALVGHQIATLSAHQALKDLSVVLLMLAAGVLLAALLRMAGSGFTSDGQLALVALLAGACVVFRMVDRPTLAQGGFALSIGQGAWLALISCAVIVVGDARAAFGARRDAEDRDGPSEATLMKAWDGFSGWTPEN